MDLFNIILYTATYEILNDSYFLHIQANAHWSNAFSFTMHYKQEQ